MTNQEECTSDVLESVDYSSVREACQKATTSFHNLVAIATRYAGTENMTAQDLFSVLDVVAKAQQALDDLADRVRDLPSNATEN